MRATVAFARENGWDLARFEAALEAVDEVLDEAVAASVGQFQEDSRRATQEALDQVSLRQRATEQAWARARLERSKLRTILRNLPAAVWVVNAEGAIIGANREARKMLGLRPSKGSDRPNVHRLGPEYQVSRPDGTVKPSGELPIVRALRGETVSQEEYLWRVDGSDRSIAVNAGPLTDAAGRVVGAVAVVLDVTDRVGLEAQLQKQRAEAEESSRHKTRLVSALSHDVRTPLNAVVLAAQLLEIHLDSDPEPEVQQCLRTIRHSVRNVLDLIGDLLDLSKLDAGAQPPTASRFALQAMLAECVASIEPQARLKGLDVALEPGPLAGLDVETDRAKLKQIVGNLLSNALRYTPRGRIRVLGGREDGRITIAVEDTGVGIAAADQARVFDEFAVLDNPERREGEGTGLGLAICRRLALLLGGEIRLRSTPGDGSTFTLVMPGSAVVVAASRGDGAPAAGADTDPAPHGDGAVLVAEDHDDSRQTLARVLRRMGFRVLEAADGAQALDAARAEPDLRAVLMDVIMPGMDGVAATLALRADPRLEHVPIFALTGDVTAANQQRIAEAGVDGFLQKPVSWEALREALDTAERGRGGP
jgi:signal transduction histidine kinase/CheY-like chemotaxis protein